MEEVAAMRIDKWLWAVRLYRTRTLAADACRAGHVLIGAHTVKPAREVHPNEIIRAQVAGVNRTVRVVALLQQRVAARIVGQFMEDLTPPSEFERARQANLQPGFYRPKGAGRPTKKERRAMLGLRNLSPGSTTD